MWNLLRAQRKSENVPRNFNRLSFSLGLRRSKSLAESMKCYMACHIVSKHMCKSIRHHVSDEGQGCGVIVTLFTVTSTQSKARLMKCVGRLSLPFFTHTHRLAWPPFLVCFAKSVFFRFKVDIQLRLVSRFWFSKKTTSVGGLTALISWLDFNDRVRSCSNRNIRAKEKKKGGDKTTLIAIPLMPQPCELPHGGCCSTAERMPTC